MTQSSQTISPLRQRMIDDMTQRRLDPKTQEAYIRSVIKLTRFLGRSPDTASADDLRRFQLHLAQNGVSNTTINATITGLLRTSGRIVQCVSWTRAQSLAFFCVRSPHG